MKELFKDMTFDELMDYLHRMENRANEIMKLITKATDVETLNKLDSEKEMIEEVLNTIEECMIDQKEKHKLQLNELRNQILEMKEGVTDEKILKILDQKLKECDDLEIDLN